MAKIQIVAAGLAVAMLAPGIARADSGSLPGGATIAFNRLFLHEGNSATLVQPAKNPDSLWAYFNLAHCVCSQYVAAGAVDPSAYHEATYAYELLLQNQTTPIHAPLEVWVGTSCDDTIMRPLNCHKIDTAGVADIATIQTTNGITPEVPIFDLMEPSDQTMGCEQRVLSTAEWAISDVNPDGTIGTTPQYFVSQGINTDSLPPPLPTVFRAEGAENAIQVSWDAPTGDVADIAYYQALCANSLGDPGVTSSIAPRYMTARRLCGAALDIPLVPSQVNTAAISLDAGIDAAVDAGPVDADLTDAAPDIMLPQGLAQLDPSYVCGETADATATSLRIEGLKNGEPYTVLLLAIDKFGNASGTYFLSTLTPKPVTDFWEDVHDRGGNLDGGFCLIADTYGDGSTLTRALRAFRDDTLAHTAFGRWLTTFYYASFAKLGALVQGHLVLRIIAGIVLLPFVALALLWHVLTLPVVLALIALSMIGRRRRRLRLRAAHTSPPAPRRGAKLAAATTIAVVIAWAPSRASAQTPYWDDQMSQSATDTQAVADEPSIVRWHVGVRVGPYVPNIDAGLGMSSNGPYHQMFGGYAIMPMLDVDRVLWRGIGQFGVGLSLGYMGKSAHAFVDGSSPSDPNRPRSPGDTNSFRMIPVQVTAVYRFSWLDDEYGIPVVPYARAGLGYYAWWVTAPSGDFAKVVKPDGSTDKAIGASLGVVGSIGVAVRAERIDASAARSMHDSGIEHAGFYAELSAGQVDGLGIQKNRPSVGDATWFAGVDFEF